MSDAGEEKEKFELGRSLNLVPGLGINVTKILADVAQAQKRIPKAENVNMMTKRKFWQTMKNMSKGRELGAKK